jgi:hypothetical protein
VLTTNLVSSMTRVIFSPEESPVLGPGPTLIDNFPIDIYINLKTIKKYHLTGYDFFSDSIHLNP